MVAQPFSLTGCKIATSRLHHRHRRTVLAPSVQEGELAQSASANIILCAKHYIGSRRKGQSERTYLSFGHCGVMLHISYRRSFSSLNKCAVVTFSFAAMRPHQHSVVRCTAAAYSEPGYVPRRLSRILFVYLQVSERSRLRLLLRELRPPCLLVVRHVDVLRHASVSYRPYPLLRYHGVERLEALARHSDVQQRTVLAVVLVA